MNLSDRVADAVAMQRTSGGLSSNIPALMALPKPSSPADGSLALLLQNDPFSLSRLRLRLRPVEVASERRSFHAVTVVDGMACVNAGRWHSLLDAPQALVVPASVDAYRLEPLQPSTHMLLAQAA